MIIGKLPFMTIKEIITLDINWYSIKIPNKAKSFIKGLLVKNQLID